MKIEYHLYHHFDRATEKALEDIDRKIDTLTRKVDDLSVQTGGNAKIKELIEKLNTERDNLELAVNVANRSIK